MKDRCVIDFISIVLYSSFLFFLKLMELIMKYVEMKIRLTLLLIILTATVAGRDFVHPGISHKKSDLDRMRLMVNASVDPWKTSFIQLKSESSASYSYVVNGNNSITVVDPDNSSYSAFSNDVEAAYLNSLMWSVTGDIRHAQKCVEIFNTWQNLTCFTGGGTESLNAGRVIWKLLEAAEIIKSSYDGWLLSDIQKFKDMLVYPGYTSTTIPPDLSDSNGTFYWRMYMGDAGRHGNQELFGWRGIMAMGVFLDNEIMYERALRYLKGEQHRSDDLPYQSGPPIIGNTPVSPNSNLYYTYYGFQSGYSNSQADYGYNGVLRHYIWENGQCQESSRDQDHAILGVGLYASLAEIAWNQGDDLYSMLDKRILKGYEFALKYNVSYNYSFDDQVVPWEPTVENGQYLRRRDRSGRWESLKINPYNENVYTTPELSRGLGFKSDKRPIYELALAHYRDRMGISSELYKWTKRANEISYSELGVEKNGWSLDHLGWGELTERRIADCAGEPVTFEAKKPVYGFHELSVNSTIIEAEDFDYFTSHLNGRSYNDLSGTKIANAYRPDSTATVANCSAGGYKVKDLVAGEWMNYSIRVPVTARYDVKINYTSSASGGKVKLAFGGTDKTGEVTLPQTGSDVWADYTFSNIALNSGAQSLRITLAGTSNVIELNSITITFVPVTNKHVAIKSGTWNDVATWNKGTVPAASDSVLILPGYTVTLNANAVCKNLIVSGTCLQTTDNSTYYTLTTGDDIFVTDGGLFTMGANVTCGSVNITRGGTINSNGNGKLYVNGNINISDGGTYTINSDTYCSNIYIGAGSYLNSATSGSIVRGLYVGYVEIKESTGSYTITNDGTFGATTMQGEGSGIRIFFSSKSSSLTISGTGVSNIGAILPTKTTVSTGFTLNLNQSISLGKNDAASLSLQDNGVINNSSRTCNIATGVNVILAGYLHGNTSGPTSAQAGFVYNVFGTLNLATKNAVFNLYSGTTGNSVVNVKSGGSLLLGPVVKLISRAESCTAFINPESGSTVSYGGSSAASFTMTPSGGTIPSLPASYANLVIDNSNGITLPGNFSVSSVLSINQNLTAGEITLLPGANATLAEGKTLTANLLTLNSNVNGTATFINHSTSEIQNARVQQFLPDARNWYISSPVSGASIPVSGYSVFRYDETGSHSSDPAGPYWFTPAGEFTTGIGYIVKPTTAGATIQFDGTLNSGEVEVDITHSGADKTGFNLIGNPYPCHLGWTFDFAAANSALIESSIWVRTNKGTTNNSGLWSFATFNATSSESVPSVVNAGIIAPMQAFWVKAKTAGKLTLNSSLSKSHQVSNPLKVHTKSKTDRQRLRLEVSNGTTKDETLLYFERDASDEYDAYDSPKMFVNSSLKPEIYSITGSDNLVINGMNSYNHGTVIPLGLNAREGLVLTISATQVQNFDAETKILLIDNDTKTETNLISGDTYTFTSAATISTDRFSLMFKSTSGTTDVDNLPDAIRTSVFQGDIVVACSNPIEPDSWVRVYNCLGQIVHQEVITNSLTRIRRSIGRGTFIVKVRNGNKYNSDILIL